MDKPYSPLSRIHLIALVVVLLIALNSMWLNIFSTLDNRLSDFVVRHVAQQLSPDTNIVIVDIDEASLAAMQDTAGSWPWPRAVHGELLQGIARQQPRAIVFDILFSEPDRYRPESDRFFNEVLHDLHNVYFPMLQLEGNQAGGVPLSEIARVIDLPHAANADPPIQEGRHDCSKSPPRNPPPSTPHPICRHRILRRSLEQMSVHQD